MKAGRAVTHFLEHHRTPDDYLYLLLDGLADCAPEHPLSVPSLVQSLGDAAVSRVLRPDLAHTPDACPALVQLARPGESPALQHLEWSAERASRDTGYHKRYVCGWLLSPQPLDIIAGHIATRCHTIAGKDGRPLPWFEPLRLELFCATAVSEKSWLLCPIRFWLLPLSWGTHAVIRGTDDPAEVVMPEAAHQAQQWAPLISNFLGIWQHLLQRPAGFAPWRWTGDTVLPPQAALHALRLVRDAYAFGLRSHRDIIALCLHRVFIHPLLLRHPEIQALITKAGSGALDLQGHFASHYSEALWKRTFTDLPHAKDYS
ncbi:hypothetical protein CSV86_016500 [Pseudomonas putida CSV86]|uniref:Uncharacterized protein n=1 Tax=Pseudomonas bharatica CSV86 TaxID=1005395 RepID=L1LX81_9PSED|nr:MULTISPECIES: hypothetical protein [Pseudomonas]MDG9882648.1 hypothetical protein [Pseudomonas sp. GD04058]NNJ16696.1 hypothetical protein [Pseudomonas bharatica CSV86]